MKKALRIFRIIICVIGMAASLFFVFTEGLMLITGDWKLFENESLALIRYFIRLLFSVFAFAICFIAVWKKNRSFWREGLCLLIVSLSVAPFVSNCLGWCMALLCVLFLLSEQQVRSLFFRKYKE